MRSSYVRSRAQWISEGEKPTKYFCALEHRNFIEKTIKKLTLNNGTVLNEQSEILNEVRNYYKNLFSKKDNQDINNMNLSELLNNVEVPKLKEVEKQTLNKDLTIEELSSTLQNMQNNKTPGIDGFPSEFYKVFWNKLKFFVLRSINTGFQKGMLSITLKETKQAIK